REWRRIPEQRIAHPGDIRIGLAIDADDDRFARHPIDDSDRQANAIDTINESVHRQDAMLTGFGSEPSFDSCPAICSFTAACNVSEASNKPGRWDKIQTVGIHFPKWRTVKPLDSVCIFRVR